MYEFRPAERCNQNPYTRRNFLQHAAGGFTGFLAAHGLLGGFQQALFGQDTKVKPGEPAKKGKAKSVIMLWMGGGPSQMDTFDLKPGSSNAGEFKPIQTKAPGIQISEHLPKLAEEFDKLSIIRSVVTHESEHQRGTYLMHTGHKFRPSFPFPPTGAFISYELSESFNVPGYVTIGGGGYSPTFLGFEHSPFVVNNPNEALNLIREAGRRKQQLAIAEELGKSFNEAHSVVNAKKRETFTDRISQLMDSPFAKALAVGSDDARGLYGGGGFSQQCLLARRMVEAGVKFVECHLGGWDTHNNNWESVKRLSGQLDPAFAGLMKDLKQKGLYDSTIVMWMGEFGRTPTPNKTNGRDHWANGFSVVIGGGGVQGGRIIGETDSSGMSVTKEETKIEDIIATTYYCLGMDPQKKYFSPQGSLVRATEGGKVIRNLVV